MLCIPNTSLDPKAVRKQPYISYEWPMKILVRQYQPKQPIVYHAVLWRGKASDLIGMPEFDDLVVRIISIDSTGLLTLAIDDSEAKVHPDLGYIVHSTTAGFYVLASKGFEENFEPVPIVERGQ